MSNNVLQKNIIDYWSAVERFTPPKIELDRGSQKEVLRHEDIPWLNPDKFQHKTTKTHPWIYTVFIGAIKRQDIAKHMKRQLKNKGNKDPNNDYDKSLSYLCSFQLNFKGEIKEIVSVCPII